MILFIGVVFFVLMLLIMLLVVCLVWLEKLLDGFDCMYCLYKWVGILVIVFGLLYYLLELVGFWLVGIVGKLVKGLWVEIFFDVFCGLVKELGEWLVWIFGGMLLIIFW